jgi:hypothetical protein
MRVLVIAMIISTLSLLIAVLVNTPVERGSTITVPFGGYEP